LYRERADRENTIDELKRQWGWGGFVTKDLLRCQVAARSVALIYNWWSLFVRCPEPSRSREAVTSRPLLMYAVGRQVSPAGQTTVILTSTHGEAGRAQELLTHLSLFLSGLKNTAEQLSPAQCWQRIWERILTPFRALEAACRMLFGQEAKSILVRVQMETNYPRPSANTPHAIAIRSQPWQAGFQSPHYPGHV